ncbi:sulfate reduction electron transfer complex DsrMKJOP subunit DsrJ [Desulfitibacter alkalitolerans]|uniref:sulfate reduction electron transfer complex DsrMKJOP subunit DsrJ n=1 Tax=Desulfitibacter alkalitolerans TaxID=264641 RepID=UPI00047F6C2A|nr:sulfate reduction electron transfer complex DsrMKJOP subunit DsrJ [Desulfitibacter alkalitolerans]
MNNSRNIIIGIAVLIILFTYPFWGSFGKSAAAPEVSLDTPAIQALADKNCIEDVEFMRANHMQLLSDWKVSVVREGNRVYVSESGREYAMSLQNTCLECHSNKEQFCDACHTFVDVIPNCWTCHVE